MIDPRVIREADALIAKMELHADLDTIETAEAFATVTTWRNAHGDLEVSEAAEGPFATFLEAEQWAHDHETELNRGMPPTEHPFVVTVIALTDPRRQP